MTIVSCALLVFGLTSCGADLSTPTSTTEAYMSALESGNWEEAYSYTTERDDAEGAKQYAAKLEGFQYKIDGFEVIAENISEDGERATVEVKHNFTSSMGSGDDEEKKVKLTKVGDEWLVRE